MFRTKSQNESTLFWMFKIIWNLSEGFIIDQVPRLEQFVLLKVQFITTCVQETTSVPQASILKKKEVTLIKLIRARRWKEDDHFFLQYLPRTNRPPTTQIVGPAPREPGCPSTCTKLGRREGHQPVGATPSCREAKASAIPAPSTPTPSATLPPRGTAGTSSRPFRLSTFKKHGKMMKKHTKKWSCKIF